VFNVVNLHVYHYAGNNPVKYTDPDGKIPQSAHLARNDQQKGFAPSNQETMQMLVYLGLFENKGKTVTHNIAPHMNTVFGRILTFFSGIFGKSQTGKNTDFRGAKGTVFEGMQFIYDGKDLVTDSVNMGTFDTVSPLRNLLGHFLKMLFHGLFGEMVILKILMI
jgi:hypothetical protein